VANIDPSGHNIGELIRHGGALTTREVLALLHETCRDSAAAFPQSPDDLWITDTGELLIARSDQIAAPVDPRSGVAALLEAMLPPEGSTDPSRIVPRALRGLPARLRSTSEDVGPQDRRDLMSILAWHMGGDPREVIQQLVHRVFAPAPVAAVENTTPDDVDLFPTSKEDVTSTPPASVNETPVPAPAPAAVLTSRPERREPRARASTAFALAGLAFLLVGIGSASYWLFSDDLDDVPEVVAEESAPSDVETPASVTGTDVAIAPSTPAPAAEQPRPSELPRPIEPSPELKSPVVVDATPRPLTLAINDGAFSPAFASTGRELFFHAGRSSGGRLLVANLDDSGDVARVSAVRNDGARDYHPRISPDGRWIAFDSDRDGDRGVYVAGRDGRSLQRVSGPGYAAVPSWSPDMKWLAFIRGESSRPRVWNLWLRDVSTGALQRHTSFKSGQVWGASWFPDGKALAYSHDQQLIISHLDAREDIRIDTPRRGRLVRTPAVSPDGRAVVFQVFRDGVWLFDVKTRTMRRILDDPSAEEFAWSPDGDRIAYHSRRDGAWKIWVMQVN
jgi:Tol biopolymer transport system component